MELEVATENRGPILHFEAHGDDQGLALADGTHLPWTMLTPRLTAINRACHMNLLVLAMMCQGWDLTASLMPNDRSPLFMLVGPPSALSSRAIQDAARDFYSSLLNTWDLNTGLSQMNGGRPFAEWPIRPATAEILFCRVFRYYKENLQSGTSLQDQENRLVADIARAQGLSVVQSAALRVDVHERLTDHAWWYEHFRRPFLMLDLFPENASRFGLTYDKCVGNGGTK